MLCCLSTAFKNNEEKFLRSRFTLRDFSIHVVMNHLAAGSCGGVLLRGRVRKRLKSY